MVKEFSAVPVFRSLLYLLYMPEANTKFWLLPKNLNFLILYSLNLGSKADSKTVRGSAACGMQLKTNFWEIFFRLLEEYLFLLKLESELEPIILFAGPVAD